MQGKRILLGVTGGIAAYKSPDLVRRLRDRGAEVQVVMTAAAREFVTAATFQAVSGRSVRTDLWDAAAEAAMGHIELARWAELVLIAPASADFLARLSAGIADDLLSTLVPGHRGAHRSCTGDESCHVGQRGNACECRDAAAARRAGVRTRRGRSGLRRGWCGPDARTTRAGRSREHSAAGRWPAERAPCVDYRRTDARAHRSGSIHQQSQLREDGVRGCAGGA